MSVAIRGIGLDDTTAKRLARLQVIVSKSKSLTEAYVLSFAEAEAIVNSHGDNAQVVVRRVKRNMAHVGVKQADYIRAIYTAYDTAGKDVPSGFSVPTLKNAYSVAANLSAKGITASHESFGKLAVIGDKLVRCNAHSGGGVMGFTNALATHGDNVEALEALVTEVEAAHNEYRRAAKAGAATRGAGKTASEKTDADESSDADDESTVVAVVEPATISLSTVSTDRLIHELTARILTGGKFTPAQVTLFDALFDAHAVAFDELVAA